MKTITVFNKKCIISNTPSYPIGMVFGIIACLFCTICSGEGNSQNNDSKIHIESTIPTEGIPPLPEDSTTSVIKDKSYYMNLLDKTSFDNRADFIQTYQLALNVDHGDFLQQFTGFAFTEENQKLVSTGPLGLNDFVQIVKLDRIVELESPTPTFSFRLNGKSIDVMKVLTERTKYGEVERFSKLVFLANDPIGWKFLVYGNPSKKDDPLLHVLTEETIKTFRTDENPEGRIYDDQQAKALNKRGMQFYDQGNYHQAIRVFEDAMEQNPFYFFPPWNAACCHSLLNQKSEAVALLEKAAELNPEMLYERIYIKKDSDLDNLRSYEPYQAFCQRKYGESMPPKEE